MSHLAATMLASSLPCAVSGVNYAGHRPGSSSPNSAATIEQLDVQRDGGCYRLSSVTYVDAKLDAVFEVLTDYDAFKRISSLYEESGSWRLIRMVLPSFTRG
jgi:hypothetical protein